MSEGLPSKTRADAMAQFWSGRHDRRFPLALSRRVGLLNTLGSRHLQSLDRVTCMAFHSSTPVPPCLLWWALAANSCRRRRFAFVLPQPDSTTRKLVVKIKRKKSRRSTLGNFKGVLRVVEGSKRLILLD